MTVFSKYSYDQELGKAARKEMHKIWPPAVCFMNKYLKKKLKKIKEEDKEQEKKNEKILATGQKNHWTSSRETFKADNDLIL